MKTQYIRPEIGIIVSGSPQHLCAGSIHRMRHGNAKDFEPIGDDLWDNAWNKQSNNDSEEQGSLPKPVSLWDD